MLMKKIFCILIALMMLFSFAACTDSNEEVTSEEATEAATVPVISLVSEKTAVVPGEEITVTLHIADAPLTACFDIFVFADDALEISDVKTCLSELILAANNETKADEEYVVVRGMVAATYDVTDDDICNITYKVGDDVPSGTKINLTLQVPTYQLGLDESGNDIYDVDCTLQGLVLEVQ